MFLKNIILSLSLAFIALPALALDLTKLDKNARENVGLYGALMNNSLVEFFYPLVLSTYGEEITTIGKFSNQAICFEFGDFSLNTKRILWDIESGAFATDRSDTNAVELYEVVKTKMAELSQELEKLSGFCTPLVLFNDSVELNNEKEFFARYMAWNDKFIEFQLWAWFDVQGKPRKETLQSMKEFYLAQFK